MGCCEARNSQDQTLNLQMKKMYNPNAMNNFQQGDRPEGGITPNVNGDIYKHLKKVKFNLIFQSE
jgi:hypothetical protein